MRCALFFTFFISLILLIPYKLGIIMIPFYR